MNIKDIKQYIRRGSTNYISGFISWQTIIKTREEIMGDSYVIDTQTQEAAKEWYKLNELGRKSIKIQKEEHKIQEDFE